MYSVLEFDLARDALRHIVKTFKIKEMHIPYYLCDVVRHTLVQEGCKPIFYHVDDNFYPIIDFKKSDYILYPNYWGICRKNVKKLVNIYPNLIVDNAHAYYDEPKGFACFNAGHKFGFEKSFLWILQNKNNVDMQIIDETAISRKNQFIELHKKYKSINLLDIDTDSIPFCYPCLTETINKADELVKNLKKEGKNIYRYWNSLPKSFSEYKFYSRLVAIPILPFV